jgi:DNA-binding Lrp family transcriptional regulator
MIDATDYQLIKVMQNGLPLVSRPYASIAQTLDISEGEVISRLSKLKQQGLVKRLGVIVNHRSLGYHANAMVVFDIPDVKVKQIGEQISQFNFVNLCYLRPRHPDVWSYNLYCMIHGKTRDKVLQQLEQLIESCDLKSFDYEVLFSRQCFKQRGASYFSKKCKS